MKAVRKLCQATLALVLTATMVFSTGITNAFADGLTTEQQTEQNNFISNLNTNINTYKTGIEKLEANNYNFATIDDALSSTNVSDEDKASIQALKDLSQSAGILNNVLETAITVPSDEAINAVKTAIDDANIGLALVQEYLNVVPNHELSLALSYKAVTVTINGTEVAANGSITVDNSYVHDVTVVATPAVTDATVNVVKSWETTNVLAIGNNTITVTVTALDNTTQDYTYTVVRGSRANDIQAMLDEFTNLLTSENIDKYVQAKEILESNGATYPYELLGNPNSNLTSEEQQLLSEFDRFLDYAWRASDIIDDFDNLVNYSVITEDERTTIEDTYKENLERALSTLASTNFDNTRTIITDETFSDIYETSGVQTASQNVSNADNAKVIINGLEMTSDTIYVGYELTNVDVEVEGVDAANVAIDNPSELVVGNNTVTVTITPLYGDPVVKTYTVVRLEKDADKGDGYDEVKTTPATVEPMVSTSEETTSTYVASSTSKNTTTESTDKKEVKKEKKYDEEVEEDKGLNGITILLIVLGIALIGFGIYMLFGDKDDEVPTVKTKPVNKPNNNKKTNKKNKR